MRRNAWIYLSLILLLTAAPAATHDQQKGASAQKHSFASPISAEQALYLIRATLLALNNANRSGNYSVLRDLAAPDFQTRNTDADLAQAFAKLRYDNLDLSVVAIAAPRLNRPPYIDNNKMLRLSGLFATKSRPINFDLVFENVAGRWKLFGISVTTPTPDSKKKKHSR